MTKAAKRSIVVFACLILAGIISLILVFFLSENGNTVVVKKGGKTIGAYSLNSDKTVDLKTNILVIENGKAYIKSADCPDKICVHHAPISKSTDTIVCLPNKIIVEIK